ncbi:MAG: hypothetical protein V3T14_08630 [Myxococcota bacterium]
MSSASGWQSSLGIVLAVLLCALATLGLACDRRVAPYVPPEEEPAFLDGPIRIPGLLNAPAEPEPARMGRSPVAIRGTIQLAPGTKPPGGATLFVIARSLGGGPPVAVRKLPPGPFPIPFELGPEDAMMPGRPLTGPVRLVARLDADGDPMTRQSEDLVGEVPDPVQVPGAPVAIVLRPQ